MTQITDKCLSVIYNQYIDSYKAIVKSNPIKKIGQAKDLNSIKEEQSIVNKDTKRYSILLVIREIHINTMPR